MGTTRVSHLHILTPENRPLGVVRLAGAGIRGLSSSSSSRGSAGGSGSGSDGADNEERLPHVWGDIPTGPGRTTAVGGGGRQFFVVGEGAEEGGAKAREPVVDFLAESRAFLDRVERGLADMKEVNDPFVIRRDETELVLDLGPAKGAFTLQRDWAQNQLVLLSPVSGINKYEYHGGRERRWLSVTEDRHDLVGMLTRDLIRICAGCPQI